MYVANVQTDLSRPRPFSDKVRGLVENLVADQVCDKIDLI